LKDKNSEIEKSISELEALENTLSILESQNYSDFEKSLNLEKIGITLQFPSWRKGEKEKYEKRRSYKQKI